MIEKRVQRREDGSTRYQVMVPGDISPNGVGWERIVEPVYTTPKYSKSQTAAANKEAQAEMEAAYEGFVNPEAEE